MKVSIKDFAINMQLGNNGIELEVKGNDEKHRGDLSVGRATIEWCPGRTQRGNGVRVSWDELIAFFESKKK